jgi:type IV secretion system protein VirD4
MTPFVPAPPKPKTKALAIILPAGLLLLNVAATQYAAAKFGYHPALGHPLIGHFYPPWDWLVWQMKFGAHAQGVFRTVQAGMAVAFCFGLFAIAAAGGRRPERHEGIHGTAHWATREEIEATGLLPRKGRPGQGVYVGGWRDERGQLRYLRHGGPEHVAAIAPTRSGKGVGLVVPTLCPGRRASSSTIRRPNSGISPRPGGRRKPLTPS